MAKPPFRETSLIRSLICLSALLLLIICAAPTAADPEPYELLGWTIPGVITWDTYYRMPPTHLNDLRVLYQRDGLLELTAKLHDYDGTEEYIAFASPAVLGYLAWLKPPFQNDWTPVRIVDTTRLEDTYYHIVYNHSGLEVSYALAQRWGIPSMNTDPRGRYLWDVELCLTNDDPNVICANEPISYEDWFRSIVQFESSG